MQLKILILLLFISLFTNHLWARNYYFRHYTNESGLSHNTVYCSLQDKQGFMWFGTQDGLNRFDGHYFKLYQHEAENNKSIKSNYITALHEDLDGIIWIGTNNGLCYYNPKTDDFSNLDSLFHYSGGIGDIKSDFQQNIWIQSYDGLFKYNKKLNQLMHYPSQLYFVPIHICISASGIPWFTSMEKSLFRYDFQNDTFIRTEILTPEEKNIFSGISAITDARHYGLLIGTDKLGLKLFDPATNSIKTLLKTDESGKSIHFRVILPYSEDEYWIGSESGLFMLNVKTGETKNFRKSLNSPYTIGDNAIYTLTKDTEGGIWAGTYFQGISYLPNEYAPFEKFFEQGNSNELKGDAVREITEDKYGNIWIGTEDAGLNKYNPQTKTFTHFMPDGKPGSISGSNLHGLMACGDTLWIGYFDKGADIFHIPSGKILKHFEAGYKPNDLKTNFVITFYRTKSGKILLGTLSGVYEYNPQSNNFTYLQSMVPYSYIYSICETHDSTLWIGSMDSGLYYKKAGGTTGCYKYNEKNINSLASDAVSSIHEDTKNRLWIATRGNGFCEFHPKTNDFTRYSVKNGLPSNFIYKILDDAKGNLWITTSNGLVCFDPETKVMKRYSKSNGITNNQFNYNSGYKDKFGKMFFGTIKGMIAFSPEEIVENNFVPPVYITGFQVFNKELNLSRNCIGQSISFVNKIVLPYDQSTFSIDFAALSYTSPEMNEYMYMLEGADKQWTDLKTYRKAYYTNLSPGEYVFHLRANNGNGHWTKEEKTLKIIINPPFWKTIWAYLVYILFLGGLVYVVLKFYTQRITLQNELKFEKMQDLKQQELLNAKIEFFTTIAHEIRTPLTLIKGPLDRILKSDSEMGTNKESLYIMQKNTNRLLDLTNQLLDFRKTEIEGTKLNFVQVNISELLQETYIRFTPVANERNLSFSLSSGQEHLEAMVDKEALTKILSNLFTNALKFADKQISVLLEKPADKSLFTVRVNNDGPLIPADMKERIFEIFFQYKEHQQHTVPNGTGIGLYLARSLAELHEGKLYLDISVHSINSFVLELPLVQSVCLKYNNKEPEFMLSEKDEEQSNLPASTNPAILVVEDEREMQSYIAGELSESYRVFKAGNGQEALNILSGNTVNIIISDILMPVMDGFELCKAVKSDINYSHIPFILLTAKHNIQSHIEGLEQGADAYIVKPFSTDHLLAQVSNLLKNRRLLTERFAQSPLVYSNTIASTKADEEFLKSLNNIILEELSDPNLNVEYLTAKLGISTSSLYRKMKGISDMNPNEFIRIIRLKRSAELLLEGNLSIKEVAYLTGFSAPSYFSTSFQKQFGMTPTEFITRNSTKTKEVPE